MGQFDPFTELFRAVEVLDSPRAAAAGISKSTMARAVRRGRVRRLARGLFVDGLVDGVDQRVLVAAALAGQGAVFSHRGAAWVHGLDGVPDFVAEFSVEHGRRLTRVLAHQRPRLEELEIVEVNGLLVTSVRQTLADLGIVTNADIVERAVESALRRGLVEELWLRDFGWIHAFDRWGSPALRHVLERRPPGAKPTGSDIETICLQVWRGGGVPEPERQFEVWQDGVLVATTDFRIPPTNLVVEVDGFETHGTPQGMQYDLNRQNRIEDAGYPVRRFTWADVMFRPRYVCRATLRALRALGYRGT